MTALEAVGVDAGYAGVPIVRDLHLAVEPGEVHLLLGPNGAGKTTTLLTLAGELRAIRGAVRVAGRETTAPLHRRARQGMALITEERSVFMGQTVKDNLRAGGASIGDVLELFPELGPHLARRAGLLSGGQQQMLTLARALARRPRVLLADELSLGLAPLVVDRLLVAVRAAADRGVAVLLVEQHVDKALSVVDRVSVLVRGRVVLSGSADELRSNPTALAELYLAFGATTSTGDPTRTSVSATADSDQQGRQ